MGITMSSVTLAANKLIKKGFLQKEKSPTDGRVAHIRLTHEGKKMYKMHRLFHHNMVTDMTGGMDDLDKEALLAVIRKLNDFFKKEVSCT
jgi:DNA-binding MarR family transcriptional regulator